MQLVRGLIVVIMIASLAGCATMQQTFSDSTSAASRGDYATAAWGIGMLAVIIGGGIRFIRAITKR